MRRFLAPVVLLIIGIAAVVGLCSSIYVWGVYYRHWESPAVTTIANTLPIPVASYRGERILLRDYFVRINSVRAFIAADQIAQEQQADVSNENRQAVVDQLLKEAIVRHVAASRNIAVSDEDVMTAIRSDLAGVGTTDEEIAAYLKDNFGWEMNGFIEQVAHPIVLERHVAASYAVDHGNDLDALNNYVAEELASDRVARYLKF